MPKASKLPPEEKVRVVELYLAGEITYMAFQKEYGISGRSLENWVRLYESEGIGALIPRMRKKEYSTELKNQVVTEYLSGGVSIEGLCKKYKISDAHVVRRWIKKYNCHEELRTISGGSEVYMTKGRKATFEERVAIVEFCISRSKDYRATIEKYSVSYQQVYDWVRKYEDLGAAGLIDQRGKRKKDANMTEVELLRAELKLKEAQNRRLQMENDLLKKLDEVERR
jgi:transposase-like protein